MESKYKVGEIRDNKYGKYKIIKVYKDEKNNYKYDIEFIDTNTIRKNISSSSLYLSNIKDCKYPYIHNVACLGGYYSPNQSEIMHKLYSRWERIISRCYNKDDKRYKDYGEVGIHVSNEWLNFKNFYNDMIKKENIEKILEGAKWQIDKDMLCKTKNIHPCIYSNDTTMIVSIYDNVSESNKRIKNYEKYKKGVNCKTIRGVDYFVAQYHNSEKLNKAGLRKYFNINTYGYDKAKELAIQQRKKWEEVYN